MQRVRSLKVVEMFKAVPSSSAVVGDYHLRLNKPWEMTHVGETGVLRLLLAISQTFLPMKLYRLQLTSPALNQHCWKQLGG
jgi:hypothetical protein